jgi:hypothetical protein
LPQSDYNVIASGNNGYTAAAGYNLVTGLGTPVANVLVSDLIAYQGPQTTYPGPIVAPMQNTELVDTGVVASGPIDVFSVFDSFTLTDHGAGQPWAHVATAMKRPGLAGSAKRASSFRQRLNIAGLTETNVPTTAAVDRLAPLPTFAASGAPLGLADPDLASTDSGVIVATAPQRVKLRAGNRPHVRAVAAGTMSRATHARLVPTLDRGAVDALFGQGWSARLSGIAEEPLSGRAIKSIEVVLSEFLGRFGGKRR